MTDDQLAFLDAYTLAGLLHSKKLSPVEVTHMMLNRIERGGNYGWSIMEGRQPTNPEWPRGPTPILPPTIDVPHSESSSITDGLTYYGSRLKELHGYHIYSDYDTGNFWGAAEKKK